MAQLRFRALTRQVTLLAAAVARPRLVALRCEVSGLATAVAAPFTGAGGRAVSFLSTTEADGWGQVSGVAYLGACRCKDGYAVGGGDAGDGVGDACGGRQGGAGLIYEGGGRHGELLCLRWTKLVLVRWKNCSFGGGELGGRVWGVALKWQCAQSRKIERDMETFGCRMHLRRDATMLVGPWQAHLSGTLQSLYCTGSPCPSPCTCHLMSELSPTFEAQRLWTRRLNPSTPHLDID